MAPAAFRPLPSGPGLPEGGPLFLLSFQGLGWGHSTRRPAGRFWGQTGGSFVLVNAASSHACPGRPLACFPAAGEVERPPGPLRAALGGCSGGSEALTSLSLNRGRGQRTVPWAAVRTVGFAARTLCCDCSALRLPWQGGWGPCTRGEQRGCVTVTLTSQSLCVPCSLIETWYSSSCGLSVCPCPPKSGRATPHLTAYLFNGRSDLGAALQHREPPFSVLVLFPLLVSVGCVKLLQSRKTP